VDKIKETIFGESPKINKPTLLEFLSEFLAVEKGGIELYTGAWARSTDPEIKRTFDEFLTQTKRHAELLTRVILEIGGDPEFISPGAKLQEARTQSMLKLEVPNHLRELADAENLLLAETKDHADWSFLKSISPSIRDDKERAAVEAIVGEVEQEEDMHLKFAKKAVDRLAHKLAFHEKSHEIEESVA
jgi:rubrerythrin